MMMGKAFIGLLLFSLVLSVFDGVGVSGEDGNVESGEGPYDAVMLIRTVYDLQNISRGLLGRYALANDIDASVTKTWNGGSGFIPIGNFYSPFSGVFDGRGYKIINLYINSSQEEGVGLFGWTSASAVIVNVCLVNVDVSGSEASNVGGLVGWNEGTVSDCNATGKVRGGACIGMLVGSNTGWVENCYATANVSGGESAGGLVGCNGGRVENSYATGYVIAPRVTGGLVGRCNYGTVNNSHAACKVSGEYCVGGLVGQSSEYGTVNNSYAICDANGSDRHVGGLVGYNGGRVENSYATSKVNGGDNVGGLIGANGGTVKNCTASGSVRGGQNVGGFIGYNEVMVNNSYATCDVSGGNYVGGFVGFNAGTVENSYATGDVTGNDCVGGLVGINRYWWSLVKYTYATGRVSGSSNVGGLVGYKRDGTTTASFWDIYTTGQTTSAGGTGKTTEEMMNKTTFTSAGWDFVNTWVIIDGVTYPFLRWLVTVPSAPQNLVARAGDGYVILTWKAPLEDGGLPITGYKIYRGTSSGGETYLTTVGNVTTYNDTGVTNGRTYYYRVSAVNDVGEGELSVEVNATPKAVPSAPRNLVARVGDGYVNLTWEAPADDGGFPVTGYKIYRGTSSGNVTNLTMVGNVLTYNDTGVTNGRTYYYRVSAVNDVGEGELSVEVNATPLGVPSAPQNLVARAGDGYVNLTWEAPDDNGGLPIVGYKIYRGTSPGNETFLTMVGSETTYYNNTRLTNGQRYYYRVSAMNGVGEGELSEEVSALPQTVEIPQTVPSAPRNLVARAGDGYVVLTWEAPADDGGSPITEYRIYRGTSPGNETLLIAVGNVLIYNDTGVTNGRTYYYRVSAVNGLGEGELSEEVSATPQSVPTTAGTSASGGVSSLHLLSALGVVIVVIVLIVLFAIRRKGKSGEGVVTFTAE